MADGVPDHTIDKVHAGRVLLDRTPEADWKRYLGAVLSRQRE
jgi:hypothetical protein